MITMPMTIKEDENEARLILNEYAIFIIQWKFEASKDHYSNILLAKSL